MNDPGANPSMTNVEVAAGLAWTVFRLRNTIRRGDILQAISGHFHQLKSPDVIWDLTGCSIAEMNRADFEAIAAASKEYEGVRRGAKTVFVGSDPATFAAVCMYTGIAALSEINVDYSAFRSLEEAERWLICSREHNCGVAPHQAGDPTCSRLACRTIRLFHSYRRHHTTREPTK